MTTVRIPKNLSGKTAPRRPPIAICFYGGCPFKPGSLESLTISPMIPQKITAPIDKLVITTYD
jgi:hypothetical protein